MRHIALILIFCLCPAAVHADITTSLVAWWGLNEGSLTTAADSSGNGHTATLNNNPTWIAGKIGSNALNFVSASSQYAEHNTAVIDPNNDNTMCAWVNESTGGTIVSVSNVVNNPFSANALWIEAVGADLAIANFAGGNFITYQVTGVVPLNQWAFVCGTFQNTGGNPAVALFVNGVSVGTGNLGGGLISGTDTTIIGAYFWGAAHRAFFEGDVDEVRIYSRILSGADIAELYAYGVIFPKHAVLGGGAHINGLKIKRPGQ